MAAPLIGPFWPGPAPEARMARASGSRSCRKTTGTSCAIPSKWGSKHVFKVRAVTTDALKHEHAGPVATLAPTDVSGSPDAPTGVALVASGPDSALHLSWSGANARGATPRVECQWLAGGSGSCGTLAQSGSTTFAGLNTGVEYSLQVRQCNSSNKCSGWVGSGSAVPYGSLSNSSITKVSSSVSGTSVSWSVSVDTNGRAATLKVTSNKGRSWSQSVNSGSGAQTYSIGSKDIGYSSTETVTVTVSDSGRGSGTKSATSGKTAAPKLSVSLSHGDVYSGTGCAQNGQQTCYMLKVTVANATSSVSCTPNTNSPYEGVWNTKTVGNGTSQPGWWQTDYGTYWVSVECHNSTQSDSAKVDNW